MQTAKLSKLLINSRKENDNLTKEISNIRGEILKEQNYVKSNRKYNRKRKLWHDITSERTKYHRMSEFKLMLLSCLRQINGCHRAVVKLWIGETYMHYNFGPADFSHSRSNSDQCLSNNAFATVQHDHSYAHASEEHDVDDDFNDSNYDEIYDKHGKWLKKHIRRIIFVLDSFRISHEGYHELRMVSKGHLPPIWRISKEKTIMSETIPYIKHPQVRFMNVEH